LFTYIYAAALLKMMLNNDNSTKTIYNTYGVSATAEERRVEFTTRCTNNPSILVVATLWLLTSVYVLLTTDCCAADAW